MKDRNLADSLVGVLFTLSLVGMYALVRSENAEPLRRRPPVSPAHEKWNLPRRRRRRGPEDACAHCEGTGICEQCAPVPCRVCRGRGLVARDESLVPRLEAMWGSAA